MSKFERRWLYKKGEEARLVETQEQLQTALDEGFKEHEHVAQAKRQVLVAAGAEDIDAVLADANKRVEDLQIELQDAEKREQELKTEVSNLKTDLDRARGRADQLEIDASQDRLKITALQADVDRLNNIRGGTDQAAGNPSAQVEVTDEAEALAKAEKIDLRDVKGTGANGKITKGDVAAAVKAKNAK